MIRSPPASSLADGASPSPYSAMRPSAKAIQPRSITRSASTILALPSTVSVSGPVEVISHLPSSGSGIRCHVDDPVGDQMAYLIVMDDRHHGNARALLFTDQIDHHRAIGGIQRSRRLVEQQDRQVRDKAACDIDALLFAARESRRRQRPQSFGYVEGSQQRACLFARMGACGAIHDQGLGHHVDGSNPGYRAQELADIADGAAADTENLPRLSRRQIDLRTLMPDTDAAAITAIIAEDHLQDRRFSGA